MTLRATYRMQFSAAFRFADALALVPYLHRLGISHLYASPIAAARADSTHGYDVVDFNRLNPALGSEDDLRQLAQALHDRGMGLIVDIVPNHMGIGGSENACWQSVLEWGPASPFAHWFDIDWTATLPAPAHHPTTGKVLVPFLGDHYGVALADGELRLRRDAEGLAVWAHGTHRLPICPRDYPLILDHAPALRGIVPDDLPIALPDGAPPEGDPTDRRWSTLKSRLAAASDADLEPALAAFTGTEGDADSWDALDTLIAGQFWRAARFTLDGDAINYRRFFTISDLAGVRVEDPEVFAATHEMTLRLMREGVVDGLRIDHIDGLLDPAGYLRRLRAQVGRPFPLHVEKILGPGEELPEDWPCDGTTGYEFANQAVGLLADPQGARELTRIYPVLTGQRRTPARVVQIAKQEVMAYPMAAELEALTGRLLDLAARDPKSADIGRAPLRAALAGVVAALDVYRTYADARGLSRQGRARIASAADRARRQAPELGRDVFDFIASVMTLDLADERPQDRDAILDTAMRIQQFTGPVMAKGLEDKALYRYARLIALNEVGSEPGQFHLSVPAFHRAARSRLQRSPLSLLASSTHDTKRGEDARARILALGGHVAAWQTAVSDWHRHLADPSAPIDANEAYFFYQMLLGAWPADADPETGPDEAALAELKDRVTAAMVKSARESGVNTRWVFGSPRYEAALEAFIDRALSPAPENAFLPSFRDFAQRILRDATANALIQLGLKLTLPGVPDIYQGAEMWEQSLVDPDNRRPVDFARRDAALSALAPDAPLWTPEMPGDLAKLAMTAGLLALRGKTPTLFSEGSYRPIAAQGAAATRFFGFVRQWRGTRLAVAAALHPARGQPEDWLDTRLSLPSGAGGRWLNLMDRTEHTTLEPPSLFGAVPLAILVGI